MAVGSKKLVQRGERDVYEMEFVRVGFQHTGEKMIVKNKDLREIIRMVGVVILACH